MMNTNDMKSAQSEDLLTQLFVETRDEQAPLEGENFTKIVMNSLPNSRALNEGRHINKQYYFDMLGLLIGLVICVLITQPQHLIAKASFILTNINTSSISISLMTVLIASVAMVGCTIAAWWAVEYKAEI